MINLLSSPQYKYLKDNILQNNNHFCDVNIENRTFPDGEHYWRIAEPEQISGKPAVYICGTIDDSAIFDVYNMCCTLVREGCSELHLVIPYFGYSTMERAVKELKASKSSERKFYAQEIKKLRAEQDKLKEKMNNLFDLRLDGELDRETFDTKRNELQIKLNRLKNKVTAHEKADIGFDETILGLLDIATKAGYIFEKSANVDLKRLLLKFVFENITLTEGQISYKLRFPFDEFVNLTISKRNKPTPYEPMQTLEKQGIQANDNENLQMGYNKFYEPQFSDKNQEVTLKNATPLQIGEQRNNELAQKSVINLNFFLANR